MIPKVDFSAKEVLQPPRRWCKSGHEAPATFRRDGPQGEDLPTRFFHVATKNREINGVFCELCLIVANAVSRQDKMKITVK